MCGRIVWRLNSKYASSTMTMRVGGLEQVDEERLVGQPAGGVVGVGDDHDVDVALRHPLEHRVLIDREVVQPRDAHDSVPVTCASMPYIENVGGMSRILRPGRPRRAAG